VRVGVVELVYLSVSNYTFDCIGLNSPYKDRESEIIRFISLKLRVRSFLLYGAIACACMGLVSILLEVEKF